jgi:hypothetical protein
MMPVGVVNPSSTIKSRCEKSKIYNKFIAQIIAQETLITKTII